MSYPWDCPNSSLSPNFLDSFLTISSSTYVKANLPLLSFHLTSFGLAFGTVSQPGRLSWGLELGLTSLFWPKS